MNDQVALNEHANIVALRNCGLLKFFMCSRLRVQPLLLQRMVAMWDSNSQHFMVGDQILEMDVDDIYFLMGLSHLSDHASFVGRGGSGVSMDSYVNDLCTLGTRKQGGKLPIQHVTNVALKIILFKVTGMARSTSAHLASKGQVLISLRAMDGVVFNWCLGLLVNLKDQLTCCR